MWIVSEEKRREEKAKRVYDGLLSKREPPSCFLAVILQEEAIEHRTFWSNVNKRSKCLWWRFSCKSRQKLKIPVILKNFGTFLEKIEDRVLWPKKNKTMAEPSKAEGRIYGIERLGDSNYQAWKISVKRVLKQKNLLKFVDGTVAKPAESDPLFHKFEQESIKCALTLMLTMSQHLQGVFADVYDPTEIWDTLKQRFTESEKLKKLFAFRDLLRCRMLEEENMREYLARVEQLAKIAVDVGCSGVTDELIGMIKLCGLPESYDSVILRAESSTDVNTADHVETFLLKGDGSGKRRKEVKADDNSETDTVRAETKKRSGRRHQKSSSNNKKNKTTCFACKKQGHFARECQFKRTTSQSSGIEQLSPEKGKDKPMWFRVSKMTMGTAGKKTSWRNPDKFKKRGLGSYSATEPIVGEDKRSIQVKTSPATMPEKRVSEAAARDYRAVLEERVRVEIDRGRRLAREYDVKSRSLGKILRLVFDHDKDDVAAIMKNQDTQVREDVDAIPKEHVADEARVGEIHRRHDSEDIERAGSSLQSKEAPAHEDSLAERYNLLKIVWTKNNDGILVPQADHMAYMQSWTQASSEGRKQLLLQDEQFYEEVKLRGKKLTPTRGGEKSTRPKEESVSAVRRTEL